MSALGGPRARTEQDSLGEVHISVTGIEVDHEQLTSAMARSVGVVTALSPYIGYAAAAEIAKSALAGTGDVRSLILATGALSEDLLDDILSPERLAGIGEHAGPPVRHPAAR